MQVLYNEYLSLVDPKFAYHYLEMCRLRPMAWFVRPGARVLLLSGQPEYRFFACAFGHDYLYDPVRADSHSNILPELARLRDHGKLLVQHTFWTEPEQYQLSFLLHSRDEFGTIYTAELCINALSALLSFPTYYLQLVRRLDALGLTYCHSDEHLLPTNRHIIDHHVRLRLLGDYVQPQIPHSVTLCLRNPS